MSVTATLPSQPPLLRKNLFPGVSLAALLLVVIMAFSLGVHLYNIDSIGDANAYYTAAVKSMLQSWSNFFFIAAEPGGSVTVDKPPLGLWIEAAFAYFLGVSGWSVSLPNILAGVFGLPLLYSMVKKTMGELAGLAAAFVMAITPVFVATNRNNTMDGMLVFFLLLAAWAFIKAAGSGKLTWLLLGAFIVGLGFNIKMLQAFLPLPAFYALYFFGSKEGWFRKIFNLGIATLLLVAVSLSWAIVVDLVPADSRPYIGSSDNNTVMGLIFGHNGVSRLDNNGLGNGAPQNGTPPPSALQAGSTDDQGAPPQQNPPPNPPQQALDACAGLSQGDACSFTTQNGNSLNGSCIAPQNFDTLVCAPRGQAPAASQPNNANVQGPPQAAVQACASLTEGENCSFTQQTGDTIQGYCITPPNFDGLACAPQGMIAQGQNSNGQGVPPAGGSALQGGGVPFSRETGSPGVLRFFSEPLSKQMSWLLPFALMSVLFALFGSPVRLPIQSGVHQALVLWGGWLLTCVVFFSMVSGIFHAYYAILLAPALGAMVGVGAAQLWVWSAEQKWISGIWVLSASGTVGFQYLAAAQYGEFSWWFLINIVLLALGSLLLFVQRRLADLVILASMLVIPFYWTMATVIFPADQNLPTAYSGVQADAAGGADRPARQGSTANLELLAYLEENTQGMEYLVAVPSSQQGAQLVIASGRPVLYMGGFGGQDDVVSADDLAEMVADNELRYVLYGGERGNKAEIADWLKSSCFMVQNFEAPGAGNTQGGDMILYDCK